MLISWFVVVLGLSLLLCVVCVINRSRNQYPEPETESTYRTNETESIQKRKTFDSTIALNIDKQMSYQDVILFTFLTVENNRSAMKFCLEVENNKKNCVMVVNDKKYSIMQCLYLS